MSALGHPCTCHQYHGHALSCPMHPGTDSRTHDLRAERDALLSLITEFVDRTPVPHIESGLNPGYCGVCLPLVKPGWAWPCVYARMERYAALLPDETPRALVGDGDTPGGGSPP